MTNPRWLPLSAFALGALFLAACSGGPKQVPSPANVGGPDQTEPVVVTSPTGVTVTVPPGASDVPITIAIAPAAAGTTVPDTVGTAIGPIVEITPHGTTFSAPVTLHLPLDPARIPTDKQLVVLKAEPGQPWAILPDVTRAGDALEVAVYDFSRFATGAVARSAGVLSITLEPADKSGFLDQGFRWLFLTEWERHRPSSLPMKISAHGGGAGCKYALHVTYATTGGTWQFDYQFPWPGDGNHEVRRLGTSLPPRRLWARGSSDWVIGQDVVVRGDVTCGEPGSLSTASSKATVVNAHFPANRVGFTREPGDVSVAAGERAGFSVHVVGGTADPSIQNEILWLRSDDGGDSWQPVGYSVPAPDNEDGLYTDDELNWYHTPPVTVADDGALFRVRACATGPALPAPQMQNDCQFSDVARLTVVPDAAPAITSYSGDQTVAEGQTATFQATVTGVPAPTLQWQHCPSHTGICVDVPGATGSSYQTPPAYSHFPDPPDRYRLIATNRAGTSSTPLMQLLVGLPSIPPSITAQPLPVSVFLGVSASFSVSASGTAPLTYRWRHDGVTIPGATLSTYDLPAVVPADAGNYSVVVTNLAGTATSADALLTVLLPTFTVGGSVSGLTGAGLVLQDNGGDALAISADGPFTFATPIAEGSVYAVTVGTQPSGQTCTVTGGTGTIALANVTSVLVTCATTVLPAFTIGGTLSGLTGAGLLLQDNGGDPLSISADGPFTFATPLAEGSSYAVTVGTQPSGQTCTVAGGAGTVALANVTSVVVTCAAAALPAFTWMGGGTTHTGQRSVYGVYDVADPANFPGERSSATSWSHPSGQLWLFGGYGYDSFGALANLADLWRFDGTSWAWMGGSSGVDNTTWGTKGVTASYNSPSSRYGAVSWTDRAGNLWLFGGRGWDSSVTAGYLNDLWRFDGAAWTWMAGSSSCNQRGTYGTQGVADPANTPGGRYGAVTWVDASGKLWLYGGYGYADATYSFLARLNDLWSFDGTSWTWVGGSTVPEQYGVYGTRGLADPANHPGARDHAASWTDGAGRLWLLGGVGHNATGYGTLADLWMFDGANWTWVGGGTGLNEPGVYGTRGTADPGNTPGARHDAVGWIDGGGRLWLFGGYGYGATGWGYLDDLWMFDGTSWTWVDGSAAVDEAGVYGTKGLADATNHPGGRYGAVSFVDASGAPWLFGGAGLGSDGVFGSLDDLWRLR